MQWLLTSHVRRYHRHYGESGRVLQDEHPVTLVRGLLQNPIRPGLCGSAKKWNWSMSQRSQLIDPRLIADENRWLAEFDESVGEQQLTSVRESLNR